MARAPLRVLFCCTGVGILNRGIESFFREAFDNLHGVPGPRGAAPQGRRSVLRAGAGRALHPPHLIARRGDRQGSSAATPTSPSSGRRSCRSCVRSGSSGPTSSSTATPISASSSTGSGAGSAFPIASCSRTAVRAGHPSSGWTSSIRSIRSVSRRRCAPASLPEKHIMVPYGLRVGAPPCSVDDGSRRALRERLALPADRPMVLSVGWISRAHKRMDYVVEEVARLPAPRPFLMLLGAIDRSSDEIIRLAHERLARTGSPRARCPTTRWRSTTRPRTASCSPRSARASAACSSRRSPTACRSSRTSTR